MKAPNLLLPRHFIDLLPSGLHMFRPFPSTNTLCLNVQTLHIQTALHGKAFAWQTLVVTISLKEPNMELQC